MNRVSNPVSWQGKGWGSEPGQATGCLKMDDFEKKAEAAYEWILSNWALGKNTEEICRQKNHIIEAFTAVLKLKANQDSGFHVGKPIFYSKDHEKELKQLIQSCDFILSWAEWRFEEIEKACLYYDTGDEGYGVNKCYEELKSLQSLKKKLHMELVLYASTPNPKERKRDTALKMLILDCFSLYSDITGMKKKVHYDGHKKTHPYEGELFDLIFGVADKLGMSKSKTEMGAFIRKAATEEWFVRLLGK